MSSKQPISQPTTNQDQNQTREKSTTFLIIDDDATFTGILERTLMRRGFKTYIAHDAKTALDLNQKHAPNLASLDLKLGGDSGLTLIQPLKDKNPSLDIVVLTGYSSIATAVEAVKLGAMDYLCKPASSDEILNAFKQEKPDGKTPEISELPPSVDRLEWEHIQKVLIDNQGNISATARALGMHRRTLQRKLQKRPVNH